VHTAEVDANATLLYAPAGQLVQAAVEKVTVYAPAAQPMHTVEPTELYEPGAHAVHKREELAPTRLLYVPAAQPMQAAEEFAARTLPYVPAAHEVQGKEDVSVL